MDVTAAAVRLCAARIDAVREDLRDLSRPTPEEGAPMPWEATGRARSVLGEAADRLSEAYARCLAAADMLTEGWPS